MEIAYDTRLFEELTINEMMEIDGGLIFTIIVGVGYATIKLGGLTVIKFVGVTAAAAAIDWLVQKGLDFVFG